MTTYTQNTYICKYIQYVNMYFVSVYMFKYTKVYKVVLFKLYNKKYFFYNKVKF